MNSADDILAFLNSTPLVIPSESVGVNMEVTTNDSWQSTSGKEEMVQTIPIVILDDGQLAFQCNGQYFIFGGIQGDEISTSLSNLNASEVLSTTLSAVTIPEENETISVQPVVSTDNSMGNATLSEEIDVVSVECEVDECNNEGNGDGKGMKMKDSNNTSGGWIPVDRLKDMLPSFSTFRCLLCHFTTQNEEAISSHPHSEFVIVSLPHSVTTNKAKAKNELVKSAEECTEKFLYLCSQCSCVNMFDTLADCKEHMIKEHHMILTAKEKLQPLPLKQINTNSVSNDKNGTITNNNNSSDTTVNSVSDNSSKASAENVARKMEISGKNKIKSLRIDPDYDVRPYKCKHVSCVMKFSSSESLALHTACHKGPNRREYACSQCGSKFDEWRHCSLHLWNSHNIDVDLYTCGVCGLHKSTSKLNLETHMKIHRDIKEYACPECGKRFKQKAQLRNHRIIHMKKNDTNSTNQPPRWYMTQKCHICFKMFADSKCLKKHIQAVHSKLKPYVCHVCGHSSARKAMLQAHLRQHTGEKPYACQTCSFRTGDHNSLRRHMMRHSGERPYKCPHCPYASIQSTCFKNHLQIRHPGKGGAFACVRCTFTTVSHASFLQHLSDHKNNLIPSDQTDDVEVFPENVAAAQLVYQCLGACPPGDGSRFQADVTARSTSDDGTKQTITIEIPTSSEVPSTDDEDTTNCFLHSEEVDTGGITIPADPTESILVD